MTAFVSAFKDANKTEHTVAKRVINEAGVDIEKLWSVSQKAVKNAIEIDMRDVAAALKSSMAEACHTMNDKAELFAREMQFSKLMPEAYTALMKGE
jgi:hypothetical protein